MRHSSLLTSLLFIAGSIVFSLSSCQKEVHINLKSSDPKIVVQGEIETGQPPFVILTNTMSFFSKIDLSTVEKSFLHGATMTVSDGSKTINLKEYSFDTGGTSKFYIYSLDTSNILANLMLGQVGKSYTLTITYNGKTYNSVTTIPAPKGVDTAWFAAPEFMTKKTPKDAVELFVNYTDPDTPGNYVRYYTKKNSEQYYPAAIFSDEVVNGKKISNISLFAGYENTANANGDSLRYFYPGDTVTLKWSEIDKGVYTFWNTFQFAVSAVGNPFSTPINVVSNISNGALGVWAGYGTSFKTLVVPH